jgi:hypothetical protein
MTTSRMEILKAGVRCSLPELALIRDAELREKCVEVWAVALAETEIERIEDIPMIPPDPSVPPPRVNQADHIRGTTTIALGMLDGMEKAVGPIQVDRDLLVAAALLHEIGKVWELSPANATRWQKDPSRTGNPAIRRSAYGVHLCLAAGLPETIAHVIDRVPDEGGWQQRTLESAIIYFADRGFWRIAERAGF